MPRRRSTTTAATSSGASPLDHSTKPAPHRPVPYPPAVALVDIDGTVVGDVEAQLTEYQLIVQGNSKERTRRNAASPQAKMFKEQLAQQLANGLMRPGFATFCATCHRAGVPVFLYTAAETEWATFLAPRILQAVRKEMRRDGEEATARAFRFAHLFTRRHCSMRVEGGCTKSITRIAPEMQAVLRRSFAMPQGADGLVRRAFLVVHYYDVTTNIDAADARRSKRARDLLFSRESFLGGVPLDKPRPSFRPWLYAALARRMRAVEDENRRSRRHDAVWRVLARRLEAYVDDVRAGRRVADPHFGALPAAMDLTASSLGATNASS